MTIELLTDRSSCDKANVLLALLDHSMCEMDHRNQ